MSEMKPMWAVPSPTQKRKMHYFNKWGESLCGSFNETVGSLHTIIDRPKCKRCLRSSPKQNK